MVKTENARIIMLDKDALSVRQIEAAVVSREKGEAIIFTFHGQPVEVAMEDGQLSIRIRIIP